MNRADLEPSTAQVVLALCWVGANIATMLLVARYGLVGWFGSLVMNAPRLVVGVVGLSLFAVCSTAFMLGLSWWVYDTNPALPGVESHV